MAETEYIDWIVYCTTDSVVRHWILPVDDAAPTTCPDNTAHSIDSLKTRVFKEILSTKTRIEEESIPTGGNFGATTLRVDATANQTSTVDRWWDIPISALSIEFTTAATHKGDIVSLVIGKNTNIGTITADVSPASAWVSQNYTAGDVVTYTHSTFGSRVYTCTTNTVSNEDPTDKDFWQHGLEVSVSQTVIDNTMLGYYINIYDGVNSDDVGMVLKVDKANSKIYVQKNPVNSFVSSPPAYIRQSVYSVKDVEIGEPWEHDVGHSKIGGSHVPADTVVTIEYVNNSTSVDKQLVGRVEYLY